MGPGTGAKGKSRLDLSDVMSMLDIEEAKVEDSVDEKPQQAAPVEAKAPDAKISIVALPQIGTQVPETIAADTKMPEVKTQELKAVAPEAKVADAGTAQAKADNALASKLLAEMEQKNAEILKLKSDMMSMQYQFKEKEHRLEHQIKEKDYKIMEMQRQLEREVEDREFRIKEKDRDIQGMSAKLEDLQKQYDAVKAELDVINEDKAKIVARAQSHKQKSEAVQAAEEPAIVAEDDDVASIFKRLTQGKPPMDEDQQEGAANEQKPKKLKTAKLYDL